MNYVFRRSMPMHATDYIADFETMGLTEDPAMAAQVSDMFIEMIDAAYLNSIGFYPVAVGSLEGQVAEDHLFRPLIRNYRPHAAPHAPRPMPMGHGPQAAPNPVHMSRAERRGHLTNNPAHGNGVIRGGQIGRGMGGRGGSDSHTSGRGGQRGI